MSSRRSYAIEQRLRMIDFLLHQYGKINRAAIEDYYGVSTPQASIDFRDYQEIAPQNMAYDKTLKCYVRSDSFRRVFP